MKYLLPDEPPIQTLIKVPERERERESISEWVTYLHYNVVPSMKHLRFGADGGQCCTCVPSSVREPFILIFSLRAACKPGPFCQRRRATALCIPSVLLTLTSSAHAGWVEVHRSQHIGQSSLQPLNLYRASVCSSSNAHFLVSDRIWRAMLIQLLSIVSFTFL